MPSKTIDSRLVTIERHLGLMSPSLVSDGAVDAQDGYDAGKQAARQARAQAERMQDLNEAEQQMLEHQRALEDLAETNAKRLAEQIREGLPAFSMERTEEDRLLAKGRENEQTVATCRLTAAGFKEELSELRRLAEQSDAAVKAAIRQVMQDEADAITDELEGALKRSIELRYQLQALGAIHYYGKHGGDFSSRTQSLINGVVPEIQTIVRVKAMETGNPKMPHYFMQEPVWVDQQPAWQAFLRELEENPHARLAF